MKSKTRGVTIQDVAKAAGVSPSSISNYLNGRHNHLRSETFERIRQCIETMGYSPNKIARQLKTGRAPMMGLLVPTVVNPYHGELAVALDAAAQSAGFRLVLGNGHRNADRECEFIDELVDYGVRGIIVTSELKNRAAMREYVRRGVAFVLFDIRTAELEVEEVDVVTIDNALITSMAVDYLVSLGHRSIAYVTSTPLVANRAARLDGYLAAVARHGLGEPLVVRKDMISAADQGDAGLAAFGQQAAAQLMQCNPRPTAVIAMNDILAIGISAGMHKLGVKVPEQISLVGIDDIQLASLMSPPLTTLRHPYAGMASSAIESLCTRLANPGMPSRESIYIPELVVRGSSAPPCA